MITTEMSAAIRPYSMAVAPLSSLRNAKNFDIDGSLVGVGPDVEFPAQHGFYGTNLKLGCAENLDF
jgi:hypothetical protein